VIHHASRFAFAAAELAIAVGVIGATLGRLLVASASGSLLRRPRRNLARLTAIALPSVATAAEREQPEAESASLEPQQLVVHRSGRDDENLPAMPNTSTLLEPASIGTRVRRSKSGPSLFSASLAGDLTAAWS
jgi:hypothetical protein